jgi:hypothetical protein
MDGAAIATYPEGVWPMLDSDAEEGNRGDPVERHLA